MAGQTGFKAGASDPRGITHIGHRDQLGDFLHAIDEGRAPAGRRPRGPQIGRDHPRDLPVGRGQGQAGRAAAGRNSRASTRIDPPVNGVTRMPRQGPPSPGSTISSICRVARWSRSPRCSRSSSRMRWRGSWAGCSTGSTRGTGKVGLENLKHGVRRPISRPAERDQIVRGVYRHFCMMLMEILHMPRKLHLTNWRDHIELVGTVAPAGPVHEREPAADLLDRPLRQLGDGGYVFGMFGFPTVSVARTLDNPYLERYLRSFRERTGQKLIPKTGGFDQMVDVLRNSRALSFLADQDAGQRGLFVDFFGRPASTHKAIALLAIEHQAPVVVGVARRIGPGFRYEILLRRRDRSRGAGPAPPMTSGFSPSVTRPRSSG